MGIYIKLFLLIAAIVSVVIVIRRINFRVELPKAMELSKLLKEKRFTLLYILDTADDLTGISSGRLYYVSEISSGQSPLLKISGKDKDELLKLLKGERSRLTFRTVLSEATPHALFVNRI